MTNTPQKIPPLGEGGGALERNVSEARGFLERVWLYTDTRASCFTVVSISPSGAVEFKHFSLEDLENYQRLFSTVERYLAKNLERWTSERYSVYFQVLPLSRKTEGRGTARDVSVGGWVFADLDFKRVVKKREFEGCREGEDHSLKCFYEEGGRIVYVERPPLSEVLEAVRKKLGEPTIVVDSGAGYHLYFRLSREVDAHELKRVLEYTVTTLGGDPQSKDLARILRLPGTVNPRVGRLCRVIYESPSMLDVDKLLSEVESKAVRKTVETVERKGALRELKEGDIMKIAELLSDAYRPGYRQSIILFLSGWLAKTGISPLSAVKVAKQLYDMTQDQDPLKTRLAAVAYSYRKAGVPIENYAGEIENVTGVKPYGLEGGVNEEAVKGRTGLQEILEEALGEDRALTVIHSLTEILQALSPWRDSVVEKIEDERPMFAVANLRRLIMSRATMRENVLKYKERVAVVAPTRVVVYDNPLGGVTKYEIQFEGATLRKPLVVGPALMEEIVDRLKAEGLVYHSRLIPDVLAAVVQGFVRKGRAEIVTEIESPGFYLINGRVTCVKYDVAEVDRERLRAALQLLNDLAENWFKHCQEKFATVVKWGVVAPFSYILKQQGKMFRWLYLFGDSATGKTTLGKVVLKMWGLDSKHEKPGASIDTSARIGYVVSMSTFPVLINEPGGALSKEDVIEIIKNAVDGTTARGKYVRGTYTEYPALAPLVITSNKFIPRDDALQRRFRILQFSYGEKIPPDKQRDFKNAVEANLTHLSEIGKCVTRLVIEDLNLLADEDSGEELLGRCYDYAGLPRPAWLTLRYDESEPVETSIVEEFRETLKKYINDLYARYVSRLVERDVERGTETLIRPDEQTLNGKLEVLLSNHMMPGVTLRRDGTVVVTRKLLDELNMSHLQLKSLAEIIGWEYKLVKVGKHPAKAIVTTKDNIYQFLLEGVD